MENPIGVGSDLQASWSPFFTFLILFCSFFCLCFKGSRVRFFGVSGAFWVHSGGPF